MNKKEVGMRKIDYTCKENDNKIKLILEDGKLDEIWVAIELDKEGWTIIGWKDLQEALKLVENE